MARSSPYRVLALLDWNNLQSRVADALPPSGRPRLRRVLSATQDEIARLLQRRDSTKRYRVRIRVYDGWHNERRPSAVRGEFEKYMAQLCVDRTIGQVSFAPEIHYGNELACASDFGPLWHTSRSGGQKMVDTSIACDTLYALGNGLADLVLIVSDDDDFVPVAFTATASGYETCLLRYDRRDLYTVTDSTRYTDLYFWGEA